MPATISINNDTLSKEELEEFARKCQLTRIGKRLRQGFRYITPRQHHSKADFEAQQQFRDAFSESAKKILSEGPDTERVWIFFKMSRGLDNVRCGVASWSKKNTRPPTVQDHYYGNCYLFSSI